MSKKSSNMRANKLNARERHIMTKKSSSPSNLDDSGSMVSRSNYSQVSASKAGGRPPGASKPFRKQPHRVGAASDCESLGPVSNAVSIGRRATGIIVPKLPQVAFVNDKYEPEMMNNRVDAQANRKKEKSHNKNQRKPLRPGKQAFAYDNSEEGEE